MVKTKTATITVGIRKPDMSGFQKVDRVQISNGVRILNGVWFLNGPNHLKTGLLVSLDHFYLQNLFCLYTQRSRLTIILNCPDLKWSQPFEIRPFEIRTIQKPTSKVSGFGIILIFGSLLYMV